MGTVLTYTELKELVLTESFSNFDAEFAERESTDVNSKPDCWPTNIREWNLVKAQAARLHILRDDIYHGRVDAHKLLDDFISINPNFNLNTDYGVNGYKILSKYILHGDPYKKSIFELYEDLGYEDATNALPYIMHMAGADLSAMRNGLKHISKKVQSLMDDNHIEMGYIGLNSVIKLLADNGEYTITPFAIVNCMNNTDNINDLGASGTLIIAGPITFNLLPGHEDKYVLGPRNLIKLSKEIRVEIKGNITIDGPWKYVSPIIDDLRKIAPVNAL